MIRVQQHPLMDSLPQHSYPLSIIHDPAQYEPLIVDHFINLKADNYNNKYAVLDYCENSFLSFPMYAAESRLLYRSDVSEEIIDFVLSNIDDGYYVFLHVDEIYLPFSHAYKRYNFGHGIMINSYSQADRVCYISGYSPEGKYSNYTISFDELALSYNDIEAAIEKHKVEYLTKIFLLKKDNTCPVPDHAVLVKSLMDFNQSVNTIKNYVRDYDLDCDTIFGLATYDLLASHYRMASDQEVVLLFKNTYLLREHKKLMNLRLSLLTKQFAGDFTSVQKQYAEIERKCEIILNLHMKHVISGSKTSLPKIAELLEEVKHQEESAVDSLITVLSMTQHE